MLTATDIKNLLQHGLNDAFVEVEGDDGVHFAATIISSEFSGKNMIQRHRMVYKVLGDKMRQDIHALVLHTKTPDEVIAN